MGQAQLYGNVTRCPRCGGKLRLLPSIMARECEGECRTRWHETDLFHATLDFPKPPVEPYWPQAPSRVWMSNTPALTSPNPFDIDESDDRGEYIAHMLGTIVQALTALDPRIRNLSAQEHEFIVSASNQFDSRGSLSDKQFSWLQDIYTRKT